MKVLFISMHGIAVVISQSMGGWWTTLCHVSHSAEARRTPNGWRRYMNMIHKGRWRWYCRSWTETKQRCNYDTTGGALSLCASVDVIERREMRTASSCALSGFKEEEEELEVFTGEEEELVCWMVSGYAMKCLLQYLWQLLWLTGWLTLRMNDCWLWRHTQSS